MRTWWPRCHRATGCPAWRTAQTSSMRSWKCAGKKRQKRGPRLITCRASWMTSTLPRKASISSSLRTQEALAPLAGSCLVHWFSCADVISHPCFLEWGYITQEDTLSTWKSILFSQADAHGSAPGPAPRWPSCFAGPTSEYSPLRRKQRLYPRCTHFGLLFTIGCETQRFRGHFNQSHPVAELNSPIKAK